LEKFQVVFEGSGAESQVFLIGQDTRLLIHAHQVSLGLASCFNHLELQ
jgi:hypothetical protein